MNENEVKRNELLARKVIKGLESRNMTGYYAANAKEALAKALELIPEGASVTMGGCMSAREIGLVDALKDGNYNFIDRDKMEDKRAAMLAAYYSKGVHSSGVPVDITLRRYIKKPGGTPPGFVIYTHQRTVYVTPDEMAVKKINCLIP